MLLLHLTKDFGGKILREVLHMVAMLAKQEIITEEEKTVITDALNQIKTEIADGTLVIFR